MGVKASTRLKKHETALTRHGHRTRPMLDMNDAAQALSDLDIDASFNGESATTSPRIQTSWNFRIDGYLGGRVGSLEYTAACEFFFFL
jgi:hypothetical protein